MLREKGTRQNEDGKVILKWDTTVLTENFSPENFKLNYNFSNTKFVLTEEIKVDLSKFNLDNFIWKRGTFINLRLDCTWNTLAPCLVTKYSSDNENQVKYWKQLDRFPRMLSTMLISGDLPGAMDFQEMTPTTYKIFRKILHAIGFVSGSSFAQDLRGNITGVASFVHGGIGIKKWYPESLDKWNQYNDIVTLIRPLAEADPSFRGGIKYLERFKTFLGRKELNGKCRFNIHLWYDPARLDTRKLQLIAIKRTVKEMNGDENNVEIVGDWNIISTADPILDEVNGKSQSDQEIYAYRDSLEAENIVMKGQQRLLSETTVEICKVLNLNETIRLNLIDIHAYAGVSVRTDHIYDNILDRVLKSPDKCGIPIKVCPAETSVDVDGEKLQLSDHYPVFSESK